MEEREFDPAPIERIQGIGGVDLVSKMAGIFFKNGRDRTESAVKGVEMNDLESIERAVHSLRSSAGNMGARELQGLCEEIETIAAGGRWDGIADLVDRLTPTYDEAVNWVKTRIEELPE